MNIIQTCLNVVLVVALCVAAAAQHEHHESGSAPARLGAVHFENSCRPEVQARFTRAMALLHSFWYEESASQFRAVAEEDPTCGVAWWGIGMTIWHPLWEPNGPNPEGLKKGLEALQKAQSIGAGTDREKQFISVLGGFYADAGKMPHLDRVIMYEHSMSGLHARFPEDRETTIFYALSLLGSAGSAPPDKTYARQRKAGALLEPLVSQEPEHPGIAHYIIHAYDYPPLAPQALEAARRYAKIAPDAPHALHMPSHIFTRLGLWQESVDSNLASAAAARKNNLVGDELHALDYLEFAYLQMGQDDKAEEVMRQVPENGKDDTRAFAALYAGAAIPVRYAVERKQWALAADLPVNALPGGRYSWANAAVYFGRALGAARSGKVEQAKVEVQKIADMERVLAGMKEDYWETQVEIQRRAAEAWLRFASGQRELGLAGMRSAVELEDSTDKHPVTPGSLVPMRALLGDMLLESKKPVKALMEYKKLLSTEPNRFVAVYGVARSAEMSGDRKLAVEMYRKLAKLGAHGDPSREELKQARIYLASDVRK
jgi:tetratricopeptide (TPR) repeat protein